MKKIKIMIIGLLTCAYIFLLMAQGSQNIKPSHKMGTIGKYMGFSNGNYLFRINTVTGQIETRKISSSFKISDKNWISLDEIN